MTATGTVVGYARCSTDSQDLNAQRQGLGELGVADDRIYLDQGFTGTETERPGLDQALAAVRTGDTLVVPKLDRLARSVPDACAIGDDLAKRGVTLSLDSPRVHGPHLGVLLCEIDHFTTITDRWGDAFGDVVLATLAVRIRQSVRQGDTVGRFGWDEALVLRPGVHSLDNVAQIAEKIRCRAEEPIHHSGVTIHATLSIGTILAVPGESVETLRSRLEAAVNAAKEAGRNAFICA